MKTLLCDEETEDAQFFVFNLFVLISDNQKHRGKVQNQNFSSRKRQKLNTSYVDLRMILI